MRVHIIVGSRSDLKVAEKACDVLDRFGIPHRVSVASAHRDPDGLRRLVKESVAEVFIGIAGLSAALPGAIASHTTRPVIGVPVGGDLCIDALLSIVQMPSGVPVASVGLNRGDNAALLAARILALSNPEIQKRMEEWVEHLRQGTEEDVSLS